MKRRRSWLTTLLALVALVYGFGSFSEALACPTSFEVSQGPTDETPCLQPCSQLCQAVAPNYFNAAKTVHLADIPDGICVQSVESANFAPEPPPPRMAALKLAYNYHSTGD